IEYRLSRLLCGQVQRQEDLSQCRGEFQGLPPAYEAAIQPSRIPDLPHVRYFLYLAAQGRENCQSHMLRPKYSLFATAQGIESGVPQLVSILLHAALWPAPLLSASLCRFLRASILHSGGGTRQVLAI